MKYWVDELSKKAYLKLESVVYNNLKNDLDYESLNDYIENLKNEKLGNLSYHFSYEELLELSEM
jgi:hypothetical protein